jgi:hypothetical protein
MFESFAAVVFTILNVIVVGVALPFELPTSFPNLSHRLFTLIGCIHLVLTRHNPVDHSQPLCACLKP